MSWWGSHEVKYFSVFLGVLYSGLDAKAEEQCADSIEEIDRFSRGFCNFCPTFPPPNGKKQTNGGP